MSKTAEYWIEKLNLQVYPRGGCFRETYRASEAIPPEALPERYDGARAFSTTIYFLLQGEQVSPLHRLKSDEGWHFYAGSPLRLHLFQPDGSYAALVLGPDFELGQVFQAVARRGCWFGAALERPDGYALLGCTVAPGFDPSDFELARRGEMLRLYPAQAALIERLAEA
ncbi:MAG: cupin domain-containing protein [Chloroflexota bacterium]